MTQGKDAIIAEAEKNSMAYEFELSARKEDCGAAFARSDLERAIRMMPAITVIEERIVHADATRDHALDAAYEVEAQPTAYAGPSLLDGWRRRMAQEIANHVIGAVRMSPQSVRYGLDAQSKEIPLPQFAMPPTGDKLARLMLAWLTLGGAHRAAVVKAFGTRYRTTKTQTCHCDAPYVFLSRDLTQDGVSVIPVMLMGQEVRCYEQVCACALCDDTWNLTVNPGGSLRATCPQLPWKTLATHGGQIIQWYDAVTCPSSSPSPSQA